MDVYYRKLMGNGSVASKFKLDSHAYKEKTAPEYAESSTLAKGSCSRCHRMKMRCSRNLPQCENCLKRKVLCDYTAWWDAKGPGPEEKLPAEGVHSSSCVRCYKLKKRCSRTYPLCGACQKVSTECVYVERRPKKAGKEEKREGKESGSEREAESATTEGVEGESGAGAEDTVFRNIDLPAYPQEAGRRNARKRTYSVAHNVVSLAVSAPAGNLEEEFLVVRPIKDENLPSLFVHTFFANYEWRYPFLSRPVYIQKLLGISFVNETFVQLDIYMVLAIGCLIYDTSYNTTHYREFFSDSLIESMVDIISYDIKSEEDLHKAHLLILLSIYAINVSNLNLIWNIVGFLDRLIVFMTDFSGKTDTCMRKRCFWTIFNLDKELSLVLNKLSQFIPTKIIRVNSDFQDTLHDGEPEAVGTLMNKAVALHELQDRMLSLKLGLVDKDQVILTQFSKELEEWRVLISLLIHKEYSELPLLPNFIGLVNLDYYYLLIELDQLSSTESRQFTLQFLSNSFSLLLSELAEKKQTDATSTYSLFWFVKFFKVIDYTVGSLPRILSPNSSKADLSLRVNEFNSNLQLMVNLLKFLLNSELKPARFVERLEAYVEKLRVISLRLAVFNPLVSDGESAKALGAELVAGFLKNADSGTN